MAPKLHFEIDTPKFVFQQLDIHLNKIIENLTVLEIRFNLYKRDFSQIHVYTIYNATQQQQMEPVYNVIPYHEYPWISVSLIFEHSLF